MRNATWTLVFFIFALIFAGCAHSSLPPAQPGAAVSGQSKSEATVAASSTLPTFRSSFVFDGTHSYTMVGTNPMTSPGSTTIRTVIIPLKLKFLSDGTVTNPAIAESKILASPIFHNALFPPLLQATQYGDAVMRSEFWNFIKSKTYHVMLASPILIPTVSLSVPSVDGGKHTSSDGVTTEAINFQYFEENIEEPLLQAHSNPATLAVFVMGDTRVLENTNPPHCCFNGYHDAIQTLSGGPTFPALWGYVASNQPTQLSHVSHEVAEWLNDPLYLAGVNTVPRWVFPSGGCGSTQLEVGDPIVLTRFNVSGFTLQDVMFLSWFARNKPSFGINGHYDLLGKFTSPAAVC